jgi:hypothetical protein
MNATSRRALLAGAPAAAAGALLAGTAVNTVAIGRAKADEVDPVFTVIAEHRAAFVAVVAAYAREDRVEDDDEITDAAQERAGDAGYDLFTTAPTTVAGAAALLEYLGTAATAYNPRRTILDWYGEGRWYGAGPDHVTAFPSFLAAALRNIMERGRA